MPAQNVTPPLPRIAYLVSQYPSLSHTFILNEITGLRDAGFDTPPISINCDTRPIERLTAHEHKERSRTWYVKAAGAASALRAHLATAVSRPEAYLRGWRAAFAAGGTDVRRVLWSIFHYTEALMIGQRMAQQGINRLHVHFATAAASVAVLLREVFPVTLSMTVHGPDEFCDAHRERLAHKVARCDLVVCISHFARSQLMLHASPDHWKKLEVCRLGIDPERYAPTVRSQDAHRPFMLISVGRLAPAKGQGLLVDVMRRLRNAGHNVKLQLVGDGPGREALRARIADAGLSDVITLLGPRNQDELPALYQQADAFVLPSFAEGIPIVLMEAMACGLPCVTTRITGIPELIEDGQNGLLSAASDVDGMVDAITALIDHPDVARSLAREATRTVNEHYHLPTNVRRLAEIFRRNAKEATCAA